MLEMSDRRRVHVALDNCYYSCWSPCVYGRYVHACMHVCMCIYMCVCQRYRKLQAIITKSMREDNMHKSNPRPQVYGAAGTAACQWHLDGCNSSGFHVVCFGRT